MAYNEELQGNNLELEEILDMINELPTSDSSGGISSENAILQVYLSTNPGDLMQSIITAVTDAGGNSNSVALVNLIGYLTGQYLMRFRHYGGNTYFVDCVDPFTGERVYSAKTENVIDITTKTISEFLEEGKTQCLPQIRFANCKFTEENGSTVYRFTVENLGGGTLTWGDKLQICCRRLYPGNKYKLRQMAEVDLTYDDFSSRFLKIEVDCQNESVFKWLFRNDRNSTKASTFSPIYFRLKRATKWNSEGEEIDAIFSNVETVWKTYIYDKSLYGGADVSSLKIK